jgi:HEAT repeat protein
VQEHCAEEWNRLKGAQNGGEAMNAAYFLGNVKSPIAVPFMSAALDTEHATAIGGVLITGLERIGSTSAVQALAAAMSLRNRQNAQSAQDALARLAHESTSPEVAREAHLALDAQGDLHKP